MISRENGSVSKRPKFLQPINISTEADSKPVSATKRALAEKRQSAAATQVNSDLTEMDIGMKPHHYESSKKAHSRKVLDSHAVA